MSKSAYIVTGAGSGIGQAIARKIIAQDGHVFGLGRNIQKLESTNRLVDGRNFAFTSADLSDASQSLAAVAKIKDWLKSHDLKLKALVNNAGIVNRSPFDQTPDEIWERQFHTNLLSAARLTREFYQELKSAAPSSVLNISSNLGIRPIPNTSAYSAIKAAMLNWTQSLAMEWAPLNIRVNALCPGLVDTPIHPFFGHSEDSEERKMAHQLSPLGRMGTSEDIAEAAWFLLSEASSWTTGSILSVDGGMGL